MAARLTYDKTKPFGAIMSLSVAALVKAQSDMARIKAVADSITTGGTVLTALEGSPEFAIAASQGGAFYADIQNIQAGLNAITCLPSLDAGN